MERITILVHFQVVEYRVEKLSATETDLMKPGTFFKNHAIKTKYGFERVVEDLILEAMSKGDFNNLQGTGKPLSQSQSQNPYVDFTQHKINQILLDNGFTPEWIMLQKDIYSEINELKKILMDKRSYFSESPLSESEAAEWANVVQNQENRLLEINRKIDKYNLIVPILEQQMCRIQMTTISDKVLSCKPDIANRVTTKPDTTKSTHSQENSSFLSLLFWWT